MTGGGARQAGMHPGRRDAAGVCPAPHAAARPLAPGHCLAPCSPCPALGVRAREKMFSGENNVARGSCGSGTQFWDSGREGRGSDQGSADARGAAPAHGALRLPGTASGHMQLAQGAQACGERGLDHCWRARVAARRGRGRRHLRRGDVWLCLQRRRSPPPVLLTTALFALAFRCASAKYGDRPGQARLPVTPSARAAGPPLPRAWCAAPTGSRAPNITRRLSVGVWVGARVCARVRACARVSAIARVRLRTQMRDSAFSNYGHHGKKYSNDPSMWPDKYRKSIDPPRHCGVRASTPRACASCPASRAP